ncbi:HD domain-containing protein [Lacinutrix venerupis]|uniref:Phosphohydrolase n=1 Tax=Lacinutrix venerupis TaxID=1486034 RepID=A0AAC9LPU2_9FLAO|nr:Pycsar system effector family protein [Lacinutrix venerupis]APY01347.1 phosphohydrolase [Lacinutrix venerupis]RLJ61527.1 HD domain-containing protein [Lacinutrix venerupis]
MSSIVEISENYVLELFKEHLPNTFIYHDFTHTKRVFKSTKELIENSEINVNEEKILLLAALFHDTGYIKTREGHEEESVKIATKFLNDNDVDKETIEAVNKCIMATKFKDSPNGKLEEIIRDADSSHFAKKYFNEASEFLRKEYELQGIKTYTAKEWRKENIKVLSENHRYYSPYAIKNWQPEKDKNLVKLMKKKKKSKAKIDKEKIKAKYKAQYKNESPERGIQTFYRVALRNHIKLSDIADTKANILLSVNAIIISVVLANLISKLDNNAYLIYPTVIFTLFCVISMVMSIIATRPNVTSGEFTKEDVINKNVNLTFFGNFHKMELKEFDWAINELLKDKNYVYSSLTKDLYYLGKVLERKYRILRITYTVFMVGIIVSVISFAIAIKNNPNADFNDVINVENTTKNYTKNSLLS